MEAIEPSYLTNPSLYPNSKNTAASQLRTETTKFSQHGDLTYQDGAQAGDILALFLNCTLAERYSYRACMMGSLIALACFLPLAFFTVNVEILKAAEVLCGIPCGVF